MASYINELANLRRGKAGEGEEATDFVTGSSKSVLSDNDMEKDESITYSGSGSDGDGDIGFVRSWEVREEAEVGDHSQGISLVSSTTGTGTGTAFRASTPNDDFYYVRKLQSSLGYPEEMTTDRGLIATDVTHRTERVMLVAWLGSIVGGHLNSRKMRKAITR